MQTGEDGSTKEEKWMERDGKGEQREMERDISFDKGEITRNWEQFLRFGSSRSPLAFLFWPLAASGAFAPFARVLIRMTSVQMDLRKTTAPNCRQISLLITDGLLFRK